MSTLWQIWELSDGGPMRWDRSFAGTQREAEAIVDQIMADHGWDGAGIRPGGDCRKSLVYVTRRDGETDKDLLKPLRKKPYTGPGLFPGPSGDIDVAVTDKAIAAQEREAAFWDKHGKGKR